MKKKLSISLCIFLLSGLLHAELQTVQLTCEYLVNPMAVDVSHPRLSWINLAGADERGQIQTAWEIRVAASKQLLIAGRADLWNSGKVISDQSVNIPYSGRPLVSRQDCWWQVRVWDRNDRESPWSDPAYWSMGLLDPGDWKAQWIGAPWQGEDALPKPRNRPPNQPLTEEEWPPPSPMLRKTFNVNREIQSARAYVTGLGLFELFVNGQKVSPDVLVPNFTLYGKRPGLEDNYISLPDNFREYRVMYLCYDIKEMLKKGDNVIGAILGNGFYNAPVHWTQSWGSPRFIGQVHITYTDGTEQVIVSDQSWKASKSPIVMDLIFDGEHYDARLEQPGWCSQGFDDTQWERVMLRRAPEGVMKAHMSPADRVMESLAPVKIEKTGEGKYRVDFGQEISGWLHLFKVTGKAGTRIGIKYICESPVGSNSYTLKGEGPESYAARFTWFVFREVELTNWPGELKPEQLRAEAVYSDVEATGKFECSNPLFNTIQKIWCRSQTDNMHMGVASDCPHRERAPYTGDGQVSCVTVMHNYDARAFYTKWIQDIQGAQNPLTGYVPNGAPWQPGCGGGVAWGAAMNIMPWEFYLYYGDMDMLRNNYGSMKGYIRYMLTWTDDQGIMLSQAPDRSKPNEWLNLGDWVAPGELPPTAMVHTFYLWRCADITAKVAKILGFTAEAEEYGQLAAKTQMAFRQKFYDPVKGTYGPFGGNVFALRMGVPADQKDRVVSALKADILANGGHLDTGIFGTQFFFEVLTENGLHQLAYEAMNKHTQPSYGWWIEQGATTTWEEWNGSGSRNHPMFGGGIVWFYRKLAGMDTDPEQPGYRHIVFHPHPAGDLSYVAYSNLTPYGEAGIEWKKEHDRFDMKVTVPVGSTATVYVPATDKNQVTENGQPVLKNKQVEFMGMEDGYAIFTTGSGIYTLSGYHPDRVVYNMPTK